MRSLRVKKRIIGVSTLILAIVLANIPVFSRAAATEIYQPYVFVENPNITAVLKNVNYDVEKAKWEANNSYTPNWSEELILHVEGSGAMPDFGASTTSNAGWHADDLRERIVEIYISDTVTKIGQNAFKDLKNLRSVRRTIQTTVGSTVTYNPVDNDPTGLNIPHSTIEIGAAAFEGCTSLVGCLNIGSSVTTIGSRAFFGCTGFTGVGAGTNLDLSGITTLGEEAFANCSSLRATLTLPAALQTLPAKVFDGCSSLYGAVLIPTNTTAIGQRAFSFCSGIESIQFQSPGQIQSIGEGAFNECTSLKSVSSIPEAIVDIPANLFKNCSSLEGSITLPAGTLTIGDSAFYGCTALTASRLVIPGDVTAIGNGSFDKTGIPEFEFNGKAPSMQPRDEIDGKRSFDQADVLRFYWDKAGWKYTLNNQTHEGYTAVMIDPEAKFEVEDNRQDGGSTLAYFLGDGNQSNLFVNHTLVVNEDNGEDLSQKLIDGLQYDPVDEQVRYYDVRLWEYYDKGSMYKRKECEGHLTYIVQVSMTIPADYDMDKGTIKGVYSLDASGNVIDLGNYQIIPDGETEKHLQFNVRKEFATREVAIVYEPNERQPDPFHIDDKRTDTTYFPSALRAGFTNTSITQDNPALYNDYFLRIMDDAQLADLNPYFTTTTDHVFTGYDISLYKNDGSGDVLQTSIPGPSSADKRLTIRVPVPKDINDVVTADFSKEDFLKNYPEYLSIWTKNAAGTSVESIPFTLSTVMEGGSETYTAEFTVTHFSEFGFRYTKPTSTANNDPFRVVDQRSLSSIQDIGRTTGRTLTASYVGNTAYDGYRLIIEDVTDTTEFTNGSTPVVTLGADDAIKVYNLTLRDPYGNAVDPMPATPLTVTMPIPNETEMNGGTVIWEPKNQTYVDVLRYKDDAGANVEDTSFVERFEVIDPVEVVTFDLTHNGQVAFVYRKPAGSVDVPFEVVWDESNVTTEGQQDTWRVDTILKAKGSDYLGKTEANGYKLQVVQVPDTSFTTNTSGEPVVDLNTDEDKEIAVYRFTLVDPAGNPVDPPTVSGLSEMNVTMPVLLNTTFGGNTINWDLNKGKVQAIRYEQTSSGRRMFHETFGTKDTTQEDNIDVIKFPLTENGEVAFIYTPDKTLAPFYIHNRTGENINFWSSYSPDDAKYNGVYLEITNPSDPSNLYQYVNPSNGKAVKSYVYTLRRIGTNEEVTTYPETMSVRMPIPTSTGEGTNAVQWVQDDGQVIEGVYRAYMDGTTPKVESMQTTVITESKEEQFQITKNGEYGLVYVPEPVVFEVKDQRSDGVKKGSNVIGDGKSNSNNTYADSYLKYNGDRYLIFKNPSPKAPTLKQLIDADAELNWYKEIEIYDIVFQDKENGGTDQTDHGEIKIRMNLPSNMNIMANEESHVLVVSQLNDALDKSIVAYNDKPLNQVSFTTNHFTDYALLYYDSASNSSTNASTGDSSATNASTGSSDGSTAGTTATGATTGSATATTATGATTSSATGSTTSTGATTGSSSSTGSSSGSGASTGSSTGASSATRASTGSTIPTAYTTNPSSGSRPDMPKTGDPGMYRMMGSAGLGLFGIYELISSIRVREKGGKRRLYRR